MTVVSSCRKQEVLTLLMTSRAAATGKRTTQVLSLHQSQVETGVEEAETTGSRDLPARDIRRFVVMTSLQCKVTGD